MKNLLKSVKVSLIFLLVLLQFSNSYSQYDVALTLTSIGTNPVKYGTNVPYIVTVYNQSSTLTVKNVDVIVRFNNGFEFAAISSNSIWTPEGTIPNAYVTKIPVEIPPGGNTLVTISLNPKPGFNDLSLWNLSAEIFGVEDINGNDVTNLDADSPHDKNNTNDAGGALNTPSDNAINGDGTGTPGSTSAATDEDDHDVAFARIYDVALKKTMEPTPPNLMYGDVITFYATIYNQGNETTGQVTIQELIPEGYTYDPALNTASALGLPSGWFITGSSQPRYIINNLAPGDSIRIPVKLILSSEQFDSLAWNNYTEVFQIRDRNNVNQSANEADSNPNSNSIYENSVLPGSPFDNVITGNGQPENEDEDDHDVAAPRIFDLAIRKVRQTSVPSYSYTQNVTYNITVFNQGNVTADSYTLVDTLPCGLEFLPALNPGWSQVGNRVFFTSNEDLIGARSRTHTLIFGVNPCYNDPANAWTNYIEISSAVAKDGKGNNDIDGTFDQILANDFQFNNLANNDTIHRFGILNNQDEDNHDLEIIQVVDLALQKKLATPPPYSYNQVIDFKIIVYNQGNVVARNLKVKDFIPKGYSYESINTANGWNTADTTYTFTKDIYPNNKDSVIIKVRINQSNGRTDWFNYAYIIQVSDTLGNTRFDDADSYVIGVNPGEAAIEPGKPGDDDIFVLGPPNTGRDEDDHDPAGFEVFDLALDKTITSSTSALTYGGQVTFNIRVTNQGGTTAKSFEVTDYLACGLNFSPTGNPGWTLVGSQLKYTYNNFLRPGQFVNIPLTLTITECSNPVLKYINRAEISNQVDSLMTGINDFDSTPDSNPNNDSPTEDDFDSVVIPIADLALDKVLPSNASTLRIGDIIDFSIVVTNQGSLPASNIQVIDYIPCGFTFLPALNPNWTVSGANVVHQPFSLAPNATNTLILRLRIGTCTSPNPYRNRAEISSFTTPDGNPDADSTPDSNPDNDPESEDDHDTETVILNIFDLTLDKQVASLPSPLVYGSNITYNIIVTNQGNVPASNIVITDYIRCGFAFSPTGNTGWSQSGSNLTYTITGPIAPGSSVSVPLILRLQECVSTRNAFGNTAEISSSPPDIDSTPDNNPNNDSPGEDDIDSTSIDIFDLSLVKSILNPQSSYSVGQNLTFQISVRNEGNVPANNVRVTDYLPCGFTFGTGNTGWTLSGTNYERIIPNITPGQTINLTLNVVAASCNTPNAYNNRAEISGGNGPNGPVRDIDSTPDTNPDNDPESEDDHDGENIIIVRANVGDFVWNDLNGNGQQDSGEPGIPGVQVQLISPTNGLIGTTTTNGSGFYQFTNVPNGSYYVVFSTPADFILSPADRGNDNTDSDITGVNGPGSTSLFTISNNVSNNTIDAGFYKCTKISGTVWYDIDKDDIWDPNENGINGITVQLFLQGTLFRSVKTGQKPGSPSDDGYFEFCAPTGSYYIKVIMPPNGLVQARPDVLGVIPIGNPNEQINDSDLTNSNGPSTTSTFTLNPGQNISTIGAGFYPMATLGNLVWDDINANGIQEPFEPRVANVLVEVFDSQNNKIAEDYTDNDGVYYIGYINSAPHYMRFNPPSGYGFTSANATDENSDSDVDHSNGLNTTATFSLTPGVNYLNFDAGLSYGALPVRYGNINAKYVDDFIRVEWQTLSEINADKFVVERFEASSNEFEAIGEVTAKGNSAQTIDYSFDDKNLDDRSEYSYRLAQYDFDGTVTYSKIVSVVLDREITSSKVYPNPAKNKFSIILPVEGQEYEIKLINSVGQAVLEQKIVSSQVNDFSLFNISKGVYTVVINNGVKTELHKLIVIE